MRMTKLTVQVAAVLLVLVFTSKLFADVYVYKDKDGVMTFTSVPCTSEQLQWGCARVEKVRQWQWKWDTNYDGKVTISDAPGWIKWIFFYPGDWVIYELLKDRGRAAEFLELTPASYGGTMSLIISLVAAPILSFMLALLIGVLIGVGEFLRTCSPSGSNEWEEHMKKEYARLPNRGLWKWLFNR